MAHRSVGRQATHPALLLGGTLFPLLLPAGEPAMREVRAPAALAPALMLATRCVFAAAG